MIKNILILMCCLLLLSAKCKRDIKETTNPGFYKKGVKVSYTFNEADTTFYLHKKLTEISGLTYSEFSDQLVAINDEKAKAYFLNPLSGEIDDEINFGKPDDYEGITSYQNMIYVVESNGNIKVIDEKSRKKIDEFNTNLSRKNDIEGLVYDTANGALYLAAKGNSKVDGNTGDEKTIFKIKKGKRDIEPKPLMSLNIIEEIKMMEQKYIDENIIASLSISSRLKNFAPSGIAIHPKSKDFYILSAKSNSLVIVSPTNGVQAVLFLNRSRHTQPEGICFAPDGTLYISNEGRSKNGTLSVFSAN